MKSLLFLTLFFGAINTYALDISTEPAKVSFKVFEHNFVNGNFSITEVCSTSGEIRKFDCRNKTQCQLDSKWDRLSCDANGITYRVATEVVLGDKNHGTYYSNLKSSKGYTSVSILADAFKGNSLITEARAYLDASDSDVANMLSTIMTNPISENPNNFLRYTIAIEN